MLKEQESENKLKLEAMQKEIKESASTSSLLKNENLPEQVIQSVEAKIEEQAKAGVEAIQGVYYETFD